MTEIADRDERPKWLEVLRAVNGRRRRAAIERTDRSDRPVGIAISQRNQAFKVGENHSKPGGGHSPLTGHIDQHRIDSLNQSRTIPDNRAKIKQMIDGVSPADQLAGDRAANLVDRQGELDGSRRRGLGGTVLNHLCIVTRFDTHVESLG